MDKNVFNLMVFTLFNLASLLKLFTSVEIFKKMCFFAKCTSYIKVFCHMSVSSYGRIHKALRYMLRFCISFYRAMHFSAKRGIAIACRLSVRLSVCLSVCL